MWLFSHLSRLELRLLENAAQGHYQYNRTKWFGLKGLQLGGEQPVVLLISINLPLYVRTPDPKSIVAQIALLNAKSTFVLIIGWGVISNGSWPSVVCNRQRFIGKKYWAGPKVEKIQPLSVLREVISAFTTPKKIMLTLIFINKNSQNL